MKNKKNEGGITAVLFVLFISTALLMFVFFPKKDFSEDENRFLAKLPVITAMSVADGGFGGDFEKYLCDNFPFRSSFVELRTETLLLSGNSEVNGVLVKEDSLAETFDIYDKPLMQRQMSAVNTFSESATASVYFALAPTAVSVCSEFSALAATSLQKEYISEFCDGLSCRTIDLYSRISNYSDEYIYFHTDHHWTALGAFYAYEKICEDMRVPSAKITDFNLKCVSSDFLGTLYSKGNFRVSPDEIYMFENKRRVLLEYDNGAAVQTFYYDEFLHEKDKYSYFLGGNPAFLKISSDCNSEMSIAVIGDSYCHIIAPFLSESFKTVWLIDPRYTTGNIAETITNLHADRILFLYNAKTLSEDKSILKMGY